MVSQRQERVNAKVEKEGKLKVIYSSSLVLFANSVAFVS